MFIYFQPLGIVFLLMPFYAALAGKLKEENPAANTSSDVIFIKPRHLLTIYLGAVVFSLLTTNHLLDNLDSESGYHALFSGLIFLRFVVYFSLGLGAIIWYHVQLNRNITEPLTPNNYTSKLHVKITRQQNSISA